MVPCHICCNRDRYSHFDLDNPMWGEPLCTSPRPIWTKAGGLCGMIGLRSLVTGYLPHNEAIQLKKPRGIKMGLKTRTVAGSCLLAREGCGFGRSRVTERRSGESTPSVIGGERGRWGCGPTPRGAEACRHGTDRGKGPRGDAGADAARHSHGAPDEPHRPHPAARDWSPRGGEAGPGCRVWGDFDSSISGARQTLIMQQCLLKHYQTDNRHCRYQNYREKGDQRRWRGSQALEEND